MLPDGVLLGIFDFRVCEVDNKVEWETLVHVCRRWRPIVFAARRRLNLRLRSPHSRNTCKGDVGQLLDIWPALPISIWAFGFDADEEEDNVIAALRHKVRVCEIFVEPASVPWTSQCEIHLTS